MISVDGVLFCYAATIRLGIMAGMARAAVMQENEHLYRLCARLVDGQDCGEKRRAAMRQELDRLKQTLETELRRAYGACAGMEPAAAGQM